MARIEINGSSEELERISIFLKNNNIHHIINGDQENFEKVNLDDVVSSERLDPSNIKVQ